MTLTVEDFDLTSFNISKADVPANAIFQLSQIAHFEVLLSVLFKTLSTVTHRDKKFTV